MPSTIVINIALLVNVTDTSMLLRGKELAKLPCIENAFLSIIDGLIDDYGAMKDLDLSAIYHYDEQVDANAVTVLPCWCDSHTHLVFTGSREKEFVDKIKGLSYAKIAARGGGILNSAKRVNETSEEKLYDEALTRLHELMKLGTGAIEIKSGYGLSVEGELKLLRVIKKLKATAPIPIKATFLGAHAFPERYKYDQEAYIDLILQEMLPVVVKEQLADYIDVFCEEGFFNIDQTERICKEGMRYGLKVKIHANQLSLSGAVQLGVQLGALSVDHLETMDEDAIQKLAASGTIGTLLPTASYFLCMPYQPARRLLSGGAAIALATDYNPGSSPSGNMNMVVSMSCIQMKLLPEEAINAATINGAFAMELEKEVGSITKGKRANLIFTKPIPSLAYLPYAFGTNLIDKVMISGKWVD